jgi:hypothetical protein
MYLLLFIIIILLFLILKENKEYFTIGGQSDCGIYHNTCDINFEELGDNQCNQYYTVNNNNTYKCKQKHHLDWRTSEDPNNIICEIDNNTMCEKYSDCGHLTEKWKPRGSLGLLREHPKIKGNWHIIEGSTCSEEFDNRFDDQIDCEKFYYIDENGQNIKCVQDLSQRLYTTVDNIEVNYCKDGENTDGIDNRFCNNEEGYAGQCTNSSVSNIYLVDSCNNISSDNCDDYYEYNTDYGDYYKCKSTTRIDQTDTTDTTDIYNCDTNLKFKCITQDEILEILKKIIRHLTAFHLTCTASGNYFPLQPYIYNPNLDEYGKQKITEFIEYLYENQFIRSPVYDLLMKYVYDGGTTGFRNMGLNINYFNINNLRITLQEITSGQLDFARTKEIQKVYLIRIILNLILYQNNDYSHIVASSILMGLYAYINTLF